MDYSYTAMRKMRADFADAHISDDAADKYESAIKEFPQLACKISLDDFVDESIQVLKKSSFEICKYYALKDDVSSFLEFEPAREDYSVADVVVANAITYSYFEEFLRSEEKGSFYHKYYSKILKEMEKYFDQAAEDLITEVYGKEYLEFKEAWLLEHPKKPRGSRKKTTE